MSHRFTHRIMSHIGDTRYTPQSIGSLAEQFGISREDFDAFRLDVQGLVDDGRIVISSQEKVVLPPLGREMIGIFRRNQRGFGFIVPDLDKRTGHGDLFVPASHTSGAMTGDHVRAAVIQERGRASAQRSPYIGRITEIIQRSDQQYVGTLCEAKPYWFVKVDGKTLPNPVIIRDPQSRNAKPGDKVAIELTQYPDEKKSAEAVITKVLGQSGDPEVETLGVMHAFHLVERFNKDILSEARQAALSFDPTTIPKDREDLTDVFTMTIDPPDAKDYDDAISIEKFDAVKPNGACYQLGVHIADVSFFVTAGSALDTEAYARGNSTYLPRRVIPMLPETLSNGVCSLQENVNRFAKSVFIEYDDEANVLGARFANTVICSDKRLTYLEAQALIDDDLKLACKHTRSTSAYPPQTFKKLKLMDELAKVIHQRRQAAGMIELALPEVELVFDEVGHVIDAQPQDDAFTHRIIEMFMVEANEAAARLFEKMDVAMIRRIHPDPVSHDIDALRQFARVAGHNIPKNPSRQELQQLLQSVKGLPSQQAVHFAVLKTLSKAEYSPQLIGHFALASEHYAHYTSPIRRYPDLILHRALDTYFQVSQAIEQSTPKRQKEIGKQLRKNPLVPTEEKLVELGKHCSTTERNSEGAERQLRNYLVLELLTEHLGEDFDGIVTGVTANGLFIQIDRYLVDGFIRTFDLHNVGRPGEQWRFNRLTGTLVAQRSGATISIGDRFTVRIAKVDPAARQLDLVIVPSEGASARPKRLKDSHQSKKEHPRMKLKQMKKEKSAKHQDNRRKKRKRH